MLIIAMLILWIAGLAIWLWSLESKYDGLQRWALTLTGVISVIASFFWLPAVQFAPWDYFQLKSGWAWNALPDALRFLSDRFDAQTVSQALALLDRFSALPTRWLVILMPTTDLWLRAVILLVGLVAFCALLWALLSALFRVKAVGSVGLLQAGSAVMVAILLLFQIPKLDSWGTLGSFGGGLIALIANVRLGWGVWAAIIGLLFIAVGGIVEVDQSRRPEEAYASHPQFIEPPPAWQRKVLPLVGAALVLLSFLVLPWVRFVPPPDRLEVAGWQQIVGTASGFLQYLGLPTPPTQWPELGQALSRPELSWLQEQIGTDVAWTGLDLVTKVAPMTIVLRVTLWLLLAVGVVTFVWSLISLAELGLEINKLMTTLCGVAAGLALLALLWYLPSVDSFGLRDDFWLSLFLLVKGARTGIGVWCALIGLGLIVAGTIVERVKWWGDVSEIQQEFARQQQR